MLFLRYKQEINKSVKYKMYKSILSGHFFVFPVGILPCFLQTFFHCDILFNIFFPRLTPV